MKITSRVLAYFDESGKLSSHNVVSFAGYAAPEHAWSEFNEHWAAALGGTGISCVSMKEAMRFDGPFYGWRDRAKDRDELLILLARTIRSFNPATIALPMDTNEFRQLNPDDQKHLRNVQYCGFEGSVKGLMNMYPRSAALHVVCDLSEEYAEKCVKLYNTLRSRDPEVKRRCWAISFADDERTPPLQAADMLAYCSRIQHDETLERLPVIERLIEILCGQLMQKEWFVFHAGTAHPGSGTFEPVGR